MNSTNIAAGSLFQPTLIRVGKAPLHLQGNDVVLDGILDHDAEEVITRLAKLGYSSVKGDDCLYIPIGKLPQETAYTVAEIVHAMIPFIPDLLEQDDTKTLHKLAELLVHKTPPTSALLMQTKMQVRAITRVMQSGDWLTALQVAEVANRSTTSPSRTSKWKKQGLIFSIPYKGRNYYPGYALDPQRQYRPRTELKLILETLGAQVTGWELAFWFDSPNSYLGGKRPKDMPATVPGKVLFAAQMGAHDRTDDL